MTSNREVQTHLSLAQQVEVLEYLRTVITVTDKAAKMAKYLNGETDHTVAERFGCTHTQVARVRVEMFGNLINRSGMRKPRSKLRELVERMETIEKRFHTSLDERDKRLDQVERLVDLIMSKG